MAAKSPMDKTFELVLAFVRKHKGLWGHADWEVFLADAAALGHELTDEARRHLGNTLEAAKHFYQAEAAVVPVPKAKSAKPKAAAQPKAKAATKKKA